MMTGDVGEELKIWANDHLGREEEAAAFALFLDRQFENLKKQEWDRAYSISVQGPYGLGKTTFLRGLAEMLKQNHPVAWVDAWRDDTFDDPFTSLSIALENAIGDFKKQEMSAGALEKVKSTSARVAKAVAKGMITKGISLVADSDTAENLVKMMAGGAEEGVDALAEELSKRQRKDYEERVTAIRDMQIAIRSALDEVDLKEGLYLPIYIFVDELDRCRPPYAIRMLETVKHLMDIMGIVFIFGIEQDQLAAAIQGQYGPGFDGHAYLRRFLDRPYRLKTPRLAASCKYWLSRFQIRMDILSAPPADLEGEAKLNSVADFISRWMELAGLTARDAVNVIDMVNTFSSLWNEEFEIELAVLVPEVIKKLLRIDSPVGDLGGFPLKGSREKVSFYDGGRDITDIYSEWTKNMSQGLEVRLNKDMPNGGLPQWVRTQLIKEFNHGRQKQLTKVRDYGAMLDLVARLSAKIEVELNDTVAITGTIGATKASP